MSRIVPTGFTRQREPRVRDKDYLGKIAKLPCLCCYIQGRGLVMPVHVAHIRCSFPRETGWREVGKGEKPSDARTAPLCPRCHMDGPHAQHRSNEAFWWQELGVYPPAFCQALTIAFECETNGFSVLRRAKEGCFPWPED